MSDDSNAVIDANGEMEHSIAAQVTLVDTNGDSVDDRAYVPDLGGNVWRIDLPRSKTSGDNRASAWQSTHDRRPSAMVLLAAN